ncbi:MAG TPA: helicase-associated domain-containing protein, partial [Roseiflexaceae bacterium]|nr:helicase-associated domain-containing protein [Roseiflexaceae bacterium]
RGGSAPTAVLEREYGVIRTHTRYPNQRAYLLALEQPPSPAERLYMMAFLLPVHTSRWADAPPAAYAIPADLLQLLPPAPERDRTLRLVPAGAPAQAIEPSYVLAERFVLILLALAQEELLEVIPNGGLNKASLVRIAKWRDPKDQVKGAWREEHWPFVAFARRVAEGAGLLRAGADAKLRPTREALEWMRRPIAERARQLLDGWVASQWDELVSFLGMKLQRAYDRDLAGAKRAILEFIRQIPPGQWVDFEAFSAAVKQLDPDFARPNGRYDTWGLINYARQPLDGFEFWDEVEGRQLQTIAGSTLHWLGLTDLGMQGDDAVSFRVNDLGAQVLGIATPDSAALPEAELPIVQPNFEVVVPAFASPYARFQLGRIADRTPTKDDVELYKLTKKSIQTALERGISYEDILRFLREETGREPPQNVAATLREWAGQHGQVSLRRGVLLETDDGVLLEQIRRDKRIKLPPVEQIDSRTWLLREADAPEFAERLRKAGYGLAGDVGDVEAPLKESDMAVLFAALDFYDLACEKLRIQSDVSDALRRRVMRLLSDKHLNRAYQASREVLQRLQDRLDTK